MARLVSISFQPHDEVYQSGSIHWQASSSRGQIAALPQIVYDDGTPFREANIWAYSRSACRLVSPRTVKSNISKLLSYANFLEEEE